MPKHLSTMPRRTLRNQRGQAVTEFAVILPVLLLVLLAIYQFGVVFNNYIQVTAAAREGARKAAVSEASVTRFAKAIGCRDVRDLKLRLAQATAVGLRFLQPAPAVTETDTPATHRPAASATAPATFMNILVSSRRCDPG